MKKEKKNQKDIKDKKNIKKKIRKKWYSLIILAIFFNSNLLIVLLSII